MKEVKRKVRTIKGLKEYTYLGCPLTRSRSAWCYRICNPDGDGKGRCGRVAPHSLKSYIQANIEDFNKKQLKKHFEKIEKMYLSNPFNNFLKPGIRVSDGKAEIMIKIKEQYSYPNGSVHSSICLKLLEDSAVLAANSKVNDAIMLTESFNTYLAYPIVSGELITKSKFISKLGNQYMVESVVTDSNGKEIARGNGTFVKSIIPFSEEIGYI